MISLIYNVASKWQLGGFQELFKDFYFILFGFFFKELVMSLLPSVLHWPFQVGIGPPDTWLSLRI